MAQDWDIKSRSDQCSHCGQPMADRQTYVSALSRGEEGFVRGDYHEACWSELEHTLAPFSVWRNVFRLPPPPAEEALKKETAESLLRRLIEQEEPENGNVIYILAVMLERKKILVERNVEHLEDGDMIRVYEHRKTKETFLITEPRLHLDQLETVQQQVVDMLGGRSGSTENDVAEPDAAGEPDAESSD